MNGDDMYIYMCTGTFSVFIHPDFVCLVKLTFQLSCVVSVFAAQCLGSKSVPVILTASLVMFVLINSLLCPCHE